MALALSRMKTSLILMTNYAVDASAWIEYLDGSLKGETVKRILEDKSTESYTCAVTYAEVISKFIRQNKNPDAARDAIINLSRIIPADEQLAESAANHHASLRKKMGTFGLADAFVVATAERFKLKIITSDSHFKDVKGALFINK